MSRTVAVAGARPLEVTRAVLGAGYAGLVNLSTLDLRETVALIEERDPWSLYVDHAMGQWPCLLSLPGFQVGNQHHGAAAQTWLRSIAFACANDKQLCHLTSTGDLTILEGRVAPPLRFEGGRVLLDVRTGAGSAAVSAERVDLCIGPRDPRWVDPAQPGGAFESFPTLQFDAGLYQLRSPGQLLHEPSKFSGERS